MIHCGVRIQPDIYPTFQILCGTHFSVLSNIIVNNLLLTNIYETRFITICGINPGAACASDSRKLL